MPPELPPGAEKYISHFWVISTSRVINPMGVPGPVPWTALDKYAERHGLLEDEIIYEDFMAYMAAMDNAYLAYASEQAEQNRKEPANAT